MLAAFALFCTWMGGQTFLLLAVVLSVVFWRVHINGEKSTALPVALFALGFLVLVFAAFILGRPISGLVILALGVAALAAWELLIRQSIWGATALVYTGFAVYCLGRNA